MILLITLQIAQPVEGNEFTKLCFLHADVFNDALKLLSGL